MTCDRILFVDDEVNLLSGLRRQLTPLYRAEFAQSGAEALQMMEEKGPFAIVVSDMRMPGMDGIEVLQEFEEKSPDTVRIMLTGNHDQETAVRAVNEGHIYRFMVKPVPPKQLSSTLDDALMQHHIAEFEKDLLERTLGGAVKILVNLLSQTAPDCFNRSLKMRHRAREIGQELQISNLWALDIAAMLSEIGWVTLPEALRSKRHHSSGLNETEKEMIRRIPSISADLLAPIPRLEEVVRTIRGADMSTGEGINPSTASLILRFVNDYTDFEEMGADQASTMNELANHTYLYGDGVINAATRIFTDKTSQNSNIPTKILTVPIGRMLPGDVTIEPIVTDDATLLLAAGEKINNVNLIKLKHHAELHKVSQDFKVKRQMIPRIE